MSDDKPSAAGTSVEDGRGAEIDPVGSVCGQRELAVACVWLAFFISLGVLLTNFGPEPAAIGAVQRAAVEHRKLLAAAEEDFAANDRELQTVNNVLALLKREMGSKSP